MHSEQLFSMALGIAAPWKITNLEFKQTDSNKELHINIDFERGAKFTDESEELCKVHDTVEKTWRHLNFFEHHCYLHCRVPRIYSSSGKINLITTPWARQGSGFTLLFEAYVLGLIESEMPIKKVAELLGENDCRIWTIFNHWVGKAIEEREISQPTILGIDETSSKKRHNYVTLGVDVEKRKVLHVTKGKGKKTIESIKNYLIEKDASPEKVTNACIDLSPSFIAGLKEHFPGTEVCFDKFHVVKLLNEAMDKLRKLEKKEHKDLKGYKYELLKRRANLTDAKKLEIEELITLYPKLGEAYRLKELFYDLWEFNTVAEASQFLEYWCEEADRQKIGPFMEFAKTLRSHKSGIVNYIKSKINNGILEGINCKVQLAKRRARGFRNTDNFISMIYFLCGKLEFNLKSGYP